MGSISNVIVKEARLGGRGMDEIALTGVDFAANDQLRFTNASLDDRAVLGVVVDDFVFTIFDHFAGRCGPGIGDQ